MKKKLMLLLLPLLLLTSCGDGVLQEKGTITSAKVTIHIYYSSGERYWYLSSSEAKNGYVITYELYKRRAYIEKTGDECFNYHGEYTWSIVRDLN